MTTREPVFYDCEASDTQGYPIEIGWAFTDPEHGVVSEGHLIRPPAEWPVAESWNKEAERLHGITLTQLSRDGRPVWEIARRMNEVLRGRELFSDALQDEAWLRLLFDASGLDPAYTIRRTDAHLIIAKAAADRRMNEVAFARAEALAAQRAPRRHRAEADARHLAILWEVVTLGV